MRISNILHTLVLLITSALMIPCNANNSQSNDLPAEMPDDVEIKFYEGGGMLPVYKKIEITSGRIVVEQRSFNDEKATTSSADVSKQELAALYKVFVENRFDSIKNEERKQTVLDAPTENISIRAGTQTFRVSSGMNDPLSKENAELYKNVKAAVLKFEADHKSAFKVVSQNSAVIKYDSKLHAFIFPKAVAAEIDETETAQIDSLICKAVAQHDAKQNENSKIGDLSEYKFQLISVLDEKSEKKVFVNAFCSPVDNKWKTELFIVTDGGKCFFNLGLNLTNNTFNNFSVNGDA